MEMSNVSSALSALSAYGSASSVNGSLANAVSISMLKDSMELNETLNTQMVKMMEASVTPYLGSNIDTYV